MPIRRRYWHPSSFWKDFDEMLDEMESRFRDAVRELPTYAQPRVSRMIPAIKGEFNVDVVEHEDEVIVVADLPGCGKEDVQVRLIEPDLLQVACRRGGEREEEEEGYYLRERFYGSMQRMVTLPVNVTDEGASATFKNGVLEARFKKTEAERGKEISID
jgi:HSP20 family protein